MANKNIKIEAKGTVIGRAIAIDKVVGNFGFNALAFIIWLAGIASALVLLGSALNVLIVDAPIAKLVNLIMALFLVYFGLRSFYVSYLKHPKLFPLAEALNQLRSGQEINLYAYFSLELAKTWNRFNGQDNTASDSDILIRAILQSPDLNFILARIGYSTEAIEPYLQKLPDKVDVVACVARALEIAVAESHHHIEDGDLFVAMCESEQSLVAFLSDVHLEIQDIANIVYWQTAVIRESIKYKKRLFDPDDLHLNGGVGKDWIFGFAPLLKNYSHDLTDSISRGGLDLDIVGHDREIDQMEEALTRGRGGNILLVGEPGVGKKTTVMGFAKRVEGGKAMGNLKNKHLLQIDLDALLAGASDGGEITQRLSSIFNEAAAAGNIIMFIENIQNLFSSGDAGKVNAIEVLLPYLDVQGLYIVGTCDVGSYTRHIAPNASLVEKFTRIDIEEPTQAEMVRILEDVVPSIEAHTGSLITYGAIKKAITDADKYIMDLPNPEKSINLIDGAAAKASASRGQTIITEHDIDEYVAEKYDIPSSEVGEAEKTKLLNLENMMHQRVIGQRPAIDALANALRRSRAGVVDSKKPIGSFLFLGTTGVGKTETAKALAEAYFGDEGRMVRFDMSEFQNKQDVYRLIGSNINGEEQPGLLTTAVREHPFSLLLFDELEKANPDVLNLFLQILDEGHLTDGSGRRVIFTNTIIIATSNAGASVIKQSIGSGVEYEKMKKGLLDYITENGIYRPEFINRFTSVIVFSPLSRAEIEQIAALMLKNLSDDLYKNKGVSLKIATDAITFLAQIGYDPVMGARPMARTIQEKVEDMLAKKLLSGELNKGDEIFIAAVDLR